MQAQGDKLQAKWSITTRAEHALVLPEPDAPALASALLVYLAYAHLPPQQASTRPAKVLSSVQAPIQAGGSPPLAFHLFDVLLKSRRGKMGPQRWARMVMLMNAH